MYFYGSLLSLINPRMLILFITSTCFPFDGELLMASIQPTFTPLVHAFYQLEQVTCIESGILRISLIIDRFMVIVHA